MYKCRNCNRVDKFELMFAPEYTGSRNFSQKYNKRNKLEISIDGYTFTPTLEFMNKHATCKYCGQNYIWTYE